MFIKRPTHIDLHLHGCRTIAVLLLAVLVLAGLAAGLNTSWAASKMASEYRIKAACLYNFIKFVQWPEHSGNGDKPSVAIAIVGEDPFEDSFEAVEGKIIKSKNKTLVIKRLGPYSDDMTFEDCDLLFICSSERSNYRKILGRINGDHLLTVSDDEKFLEDGGMINLVEMEQKVRWEINRKPIKDAELNVSSQLLRAAVRVVEE